MKKYIVIILVIAAGFYFFAPGELKKKVLGDSAISQPLVQEMMPEAQVEVRDIVANKNLSGEWVINGWVSNQNDFAIEELDLRFYFTDGFEHRTISKVLNPRGAGKPFRIKIAGHENAEYKRYEIYKAK